MPPSSSRLDRLKARFKRSTPSPPPRGSGPLLDLDRHSLGDVRVGDSFESLRRFAALNDATPIETGDYRFCSHGIWFGTTQDAVDSFGVYWRDADLLGFLPFSGWIRFSRERFGVPYWRDASTSAKFYSSTNSVRSSGRSNSTGGNCCARCGSCLRLSSQTPSSARRTRSPAVGPSVLGFASPHNWRLPLR